MLFWKFKPINSTIEYSTLSDSLLPIFKSLNPNEFRFSFCEFNSSIDIGTAEAYPQKEAMELLNLAKNYGFEAKFFSSFGREKMTACGLFGAKTPDRSVSEKWKQLEQYAEEIIQKFI